MHFDMFGPNVRVCLAQATECPNYMGKKTVLNLSVAAREGSSQTTPKRSTQKMKLCTFSMQFVSTLKHLAGRADRWICTITHKQIRTSNWRCAPKRRHSQRATIIGSI